MEHKILNISLVFTALVILLLSLANPSRAYGQYYTQTGEKKEIAIDKKVRSINDSEYVDNIAASTRVFYEKDVVEFQVKVENIGTQTLNNITVKDILPKYLELIFHPGTYYQDGNTLEWKIDSLEAGKSKTYLIRARIANSTALTATTKQTNLAETKVENLGDRDEASYFIGRVIVPATGAGDVIIKTVLVITLAATGLYFRKFARGY